MPRLIPTESFTIGVHPGTLGYDVQKLVVDKHCFKAPQQPVKQRLALIFSHSNGFTKETLHPLIRRVVQGIHQQERYQHTDLCVFAWDARNHGDSARLNEGTFLDSYTWFDNAMDTLQLVETFNLKTEYDGIIGVGHSFGATSMILAESIYPNTFTGICAIEPVMANGILDAALRAKLPMLSSLKRRDTWPSREECHQSLARRDFWKIMEPEVLDLYVVSNIVLND
ncbi:Alpha/beta hydrolase family-domain-containing protein [Chlamydoabsidia padenii]|nr:Alpha/beta hydrolase family-domain-containing protein [Chlamydoabsidia padenii]